VPEFATKVSINWLNGTKVELNGTLSNLLVFILIGRSRSCAPNGVSVET
jgi:cob(I)alamin adenosyltransferase